MPGEMTTDELNIKITAETGGAQSNISSAARELDGLKASADNADSGMSALVSAMTQAAQSMMQVSASISGSVSGLSAFQSTVDSAVSSVSYLSTASANSAAALGSMVSSTTDFTDRMGTLSDTTHGTAIGMTKLQHEILDTLSSMRDFAANMETAGESAKDTAAKIDDLATQIKSMPTQQPTVLAEGFKKLKSIVATLGIAKFVKDSNDAYITQMQNELKLTNHMKHRMNATDDEIRAVKELASAQQKLGVIGDEIQLAGAQQLTTYARQSSTLQTLIPAMNNLIAQNAGYSASVGDATSAADMLGRALNGQYTSLKRMGVTFTDAQEEILKYGNESQKAAVLADAINSKVGNMNELLAQTPTGKYKQLQNELGDLQEEIGATFQPLITSIVPVIRGAMETLTPPILNVSRGITTIGAAIASIDSPAVRGIALAAGALAVVNKLKLAIGGTSAGLLLLGVVLAGIVGSMQQEQQSIGDIVSDAMKGAETAAGGAADAMSEYNNEAQKTEKTVNRLAGFDTITKLSGGSSSGAIVDALLGDNGLNEIYAATNAANDLNDVLNGITAPNIAIDTSAALSEIQQFGKDAAFVFSHLGDDDAIYEPLTRMTNQIKNILDANGYDGDGFVNFWIGIGTQIHGVVETFKTDWVSGLQLVDSGFRNVFGELGKSWSNFWQGIGTGFSDYVNMWQAANQGDLGTASAYLLKMQRINPYFDAETKDALNKAADYFLTGDTDNANIALGSAYKGFQSDLEQLQYVLDESRKKNPLNPEFWGVSLAPTSANSISTSWDDTAYAQSPQVNRDYRSIQTSPKFIPTSVPESAVNVTVYVDGQERQAQVENDKYGG